MRKWYTYIIMLATVLFGSCNLEDTLFPEQECETDDITVRIVLSMMDSRANTRAYDPPHTDDYETTALGNEYYINQYDVEVLVFDENGNFVERATLVQATGSSTNFRTYELTGTLSNVVENKIYQMVVLANRSGSAYCSNFPSSFTASSTMTSVLEGLVYTNYTDSFTEALLTSGSKERIPMWGVVKATLVNNANITVNMLRAMAKVRVNMDATTGYTLSSVTLKQANNGGYFTPTMTDGIKIDGSTASVSNPRIPTSGLTTLTNLPFVSEPNSTSSYVIYVPEMATYSETETPRTATTWMEVAVKDNNDKDVDLGENNKLYFREYRETNSTSGVVNGSFFNVVRNYFYDYTITGVQDNSGMELTLSVKDWTDVTETFNYESELSYNDGDWTNNFGREGNTIVLKSSSEANASTVTAEYNFQINTPQTIEWMAVLEDPSMKFEFDMDKTSGKGTAEGENAIQRTVKGELLVTGSNLTLGVKAVDPSEKGQYDAKLHVYVTYSGKTIELNLVDGQESTLQHFTIRHSKL